MVRDLPRAAGGIISYFTRHKTAANLLLIVLIVAGLFSMPRMRAQFFQMLSLTMCLCPSRGRGQGPRMLMKRLCKSWNPLFWP